MLRCQTTLHRFFDGRLVNGSKLEGLKIGVDGVRVAVDLLSFTIADSIKAATLTSFGADYEPFCFRGVTAEGS